VCVLCYVYECVRVYAYVCVDKGMIMLMLVSTVPELVELIPTWPEEQTRS